MLEGFRKCFDEIEKLVSSLEFRSRSFELYTLQSLSLKIELIRIKGFSRQAVELIIESFHGKFPLEKRRVLGREPL